jgi:dihydrofolate synthase/folylpolyglutamate synthase
VNDKDLEEILPLFPRNAIYYFSKPNNPRGLDATILATKQEQTA